MEPPPAHTNNETLKNQAEARENRRRAENAKKARDTANMLFPGEKWELVEAGIYRSSHRSIGKQSNYKDELRDAQLLRNMGSTIYLTPENSRQGGKKYDAIVNGQKMEFKNVCGGINALINRFLASREQAPNVFINLEDSNLTKRQLMTALYGARNGPGYPENNGITGGRIILKIKGYGRLVFLNIDDLQAKK